MYKSITFFEKFQLFSLDICIIYRDSFYTIVEQRMYWKYKAVFLFLCMYQLFQVVKLVKPILLNYCPVTS